MRSQTVDQPLLTSSTSTVASTHFLLSRLGVPRIWDASSTVQALAVNFSVIEMPPSGQPLGYRARAIEPKGIRLHRVERREAVRPCSVLRATHLRSVRAPQLGDSSLATPACTAPRTPGRSSEAASVSRTCRACSLPGSNAQRTYCRVELELTRFR